MDRNWLTVRATAEDASAKYLHLANPSEDRLRFAAIRDRVAKWQAMVDESRNGGELWEIHTPKERAPGGGASDGVALVRGREIVEYIITIKR